MREEASIEGAFGAKFEDSRGKNKKINDETSHNNNNETYPPCLHCKKTNHLPKKCCWRPDIKCKKCGNIGHIEQVYKSQQNEEAKASIEQKEDEFFFVVTCFSNDSLLINSGYTNHMTNLSLFKELDKTIISKIKVGNGPLKIVKISIFYETIEFVIVDASLNMGIVREEKVVVQKRPAHLNRKRVRDRQEEEKGGCESWEGCKQRDIYKRYPLSSNGDV
ncbi:hypothetical protein PVK06_040122 [Gossypium arboreum]|uniref:Uncharacterized protein n=1 Tax=Gossypium arboreum TaxID=29729 RepID=A0ABR0N4N0_GOSAR|nr:hypothetical protein PVK06_040122 [Gossypium arboreum]